jgi:hypothetical protein
MSKNLTNAAVIEFDNEVKHQYQGSGKLRKTVSYRGNVTGESYKFTRMGRGLANQKATQADVTPMDISHARQTATLENWNASEYTDIFDAAEVNFDEKTELAQTIAKSISRREDQIIIDAMTAVSFAATNDGNPDTGLVLDISASRNFDFEVVRRASRHFNELEAEMADRHFAIQANVLEELLSVNQVTSSDYVSIKALMNGEINQWMGFTWHVIGTRQEGGLPGVTGDEIAYAYMKSAVGLAVGIDMKTEIDWVPQKTSWLCNGIFKAGAVAREPQGIVKVIYDETA